MRRGHSTKIGRISAAWAVVALAAGWPLTAAAQAPTIVSLSPNTGPTSGATMVTITGTNLNTVTSVTFGGANATILGSAPDGTAVGVSTPPHAAGQVDVVVTNPSGSATAVGAFMYVSSSGSAPTITSVSPNAGTTLGGTAVTISGTNFVSGASVTFNGEAATDVVVVNTTTITAVTPPGSSGPAGVTVTNPDTQAATAFDFTYSAFCDPTITVDCISLLQVNGGEPPVALSAELRRAGAGVQISVVNTANPDRFELSPDVGVSDTITIGITFAPGDDPVVAVSTGEIQGWTWNGGTRTAEVTLKPRASSWSMLGCVPPPGSCAPQASVDYTALALVALDPLLAAPSEVRADLQGAFVSTNGQYFSLPTYNEAAGALQFQVGAPSLRFDGNQNDDGFFNAFVPDPFIVGQWNLSNPDDLLDPSNSQVAIGNQVVTPVTADIAATAGSPAGVLISFSGFHYSIEDIFVIVAPTILSVSPSSGSIVGGTPVTITGLNFRSGATVTIGGVPATNVVVQNALTITATTPAGSPGAKTVVVMNADGTSDTMASAFTYVNMAPGIIPPGNQTISEDQVLSSVAFSVADSETPPSNLVVSAFSSNQTLVPNTAIVLGGAGANRTVTITPSPNQEGTAVITLVVSDGEKSASGSFTLVVAGVDDPPTISPPSTQTGPPGRVVGPLSFTVQDIDTDPEKITLVASSSNTAIVAQNAIMLGGSGTNRTFTAQTSAVEGSTTITLTALYDATPVASASFVIESVAPEPPPPGPESQAPTGLAAQIDGPIVTLSWTAPAQATGLTGYRLELGPSAGATTASVDTGAETTFTTSAIGPGTWYVRVRALINGEPGPASNEVTFTLTGAPSAPRDLIVSLNGANVTLSWKAPLAGSVGSYVVEGGTGAGLSNVGVLPVAGHQLTVTVSAAAGTYFVRVRAVNNAGTSQASNEVTFTVGGPPSAPGAPQSLQGSVAGTTVTLSWLAPASGIVPTHYVIEAGTSPGASNAGTVPVTATGYSVSGVPPGTYYVRVRAMNGSTPGPPSNEVTLIVGTPLQPPGAPSGLVATVAGSSVTLVWNAPAGGGAVASYAIVAGSSAGASDVGTFSVGAATTFSASGVASGTYYVRVVAINAAGTSAPSNEVVVAVP